LNGEFLMPQVIATAIVSAAGWGAGAYACPYALDPEAPAVVPPRVPRSELESDIAHAIEHNTLRAVQYDGFEQRHRLIGPISVIGECLARRGISPGSMLFFDPLLPICGGDVVIVRDVAGVLNSKILERLDGGWWIRADDGTAPLRIDGIPLAVLGKLVLSLHLPSECASVKWAEAQTRELYATIPAEFFKRSNDGSRALDSRSDVDRTEYPWRPMVGSHFWNGLPSFNFSEFEGQITL
jgi:hypothetical protein